MPSLIIETSTERSLVALHEGSQLLFLHEFPFGHYSSSHLLPALEAGLAQLHMQAKDLTQIICGQGPGSYTGIRIGAICAKTLAFTCRIPLIGVCSLRGFVPESDGAFSAVIDAKIGGLYVQSGFKQGNAILNWTAPTLFSYAELPPEFWNSHTLVTPHMGTLPAKLQAIQPSFNPIWEEKSPSWEALYQASLTSPSSDQAQLELLYLRKTQAEIEKKGL